MSPKKEKRRLSCLKKRRSEDNEEEATTTITKMQRKLMFSKKNEVIEFLQCEENNTIWGDKYETSVAKSETGSSSDGLFTHSSRMHSVNFSSTTIASSMIEAEKENVKFDNNKQDPVPETKRISDEASTVPEISIFMNSQEFQKFKDYSPVDITSIPLDTSVLVNKHLEGVIESNPPKVLSPRKTVFFNKDCVVTIQDKVRSDPAALEENFSLILEESSIRQPVETRKTILNAVDMDITTPKNPFKCPQIPKEFKFRKSIAGSPPIKPVESTHDKEEVDEIYDIIIQDTPSKNLCCLTPKRSASKSENRSEVSRVVRKSEQLFHEFEESSKSMDNTTFSTQCLMNISVPDDDDTAATLENTDELNKKVARLIKNPNATLRTLSRPSTSSTSLNEDSISIATPFKSSMDNVDMSLDDFSISINEDDKKKVTRQTVYDREMSMNENEVKFQIFHDSIKNVKIPEISYKNRATTFDFDDMNESNHDEKSIKITKELLKRTTSYKLTDMDETIENSNQSRKSNLNYTSEKFEENFIKTRPTTYDLEGMNESNYEEKSVKIPKELLKRTTNYKLSDMDETTENPIQNFNQTNKKSQENVIKTRPTTFEICAMEESPKKKAIQSKTEKNRATTFAHHSMEESEDEISQPKISENSKQFKNRVTSYEFQSIEESTSELKVTNELPRRNRATIFDQERMNLTGLEMNTNDKIVKNRKTIFNHEELDLTSEIKPMETEGFPKNPRRTVYEENDMELTINIENENAAKKYRATIFEPEIIAEEPKASLFKSEAFGGAKLKTRVTIHQESDMDSSNERRTIYEKNKMELTDENLEVDEPTQSFLRIQPSTSNVNIDEYGGTKPKTRVTIHQQSEMDMSGVQQLSIVNSEILSPPSAFKCPKDQSIMEMSRKSVIVQRKTTHELVDMETGNKGQKPKDDSQKWHEITDADMMLDDESNPCINETENDSNRTDKMKRMSIGNISRYEDALDDFVNLTIMASPLNATISEPIQQASKSNRLSRPLSPFRDYESMLDDFMSKLKKENLPKPRLEIDEYLEKMQIAPVKIKQRPEHHPDAILARINAKKDSIRMKNEKLQEELDKQYPKTPSIVFLMENFFECMDEEIKLKNAELVFIEPIFPEAPDFEFLMKNKFETDPHLEKYWHLNMVLWWTKNMKFTHKRLAFFTINIRSQQTNAEVNDSTIPIIFNNVLIYLGFEYRNEAVFTKRLRMLRKEFKKIVNGRENFTSICGNCNELFPFLDYYHEKVKKAWDIVNNLYSIVRKYKAIIGHEEESDYYFVNMLFFLDRDSEGYTEMLELKVPIHTYIEDIAVQDVIMTGNLYKYEIEATENVKSLKGLMLLESLLFDIRKFKEGNVKSIRIKY